MCQVVALNPFPRSADKNNPPYMRGAIYVTGSFSVLLYLFSSETAQNIRAGSSDDAICKKTPKTEYFFSGSARGLSRRLSASDMNSGAAAID